MAMLVADCPRCGSASMTHDVTAQVFRGTEYGWKHAFEVFSVCRRCERPSIVLVALRDSSLSAEFKRDGALVKYPNALNQAFEVVRVISLRDNAPRQPPEHLSKEISDAFNEGAACLSIGCHNAAAAMLRLCVDLVTRPLLPDPADTNRSQPNGKQRRDLGLRLAWLFDNGLLPEALREVAKCIREDGNDGAHVGNLTKEDAEDLVDFATVLLERLVTEPVRLRLAEERRQAR